MVLEDPLPLIVPVDEVQVVLARRIHLHWLVLLKKLDTNGLLGIFAFSRGQVEGSGGCFAADFVEVTAPRRRILHTHRPQSALALNAEVTIIEFSQIMSKDLFWVQVEESIYQHSFIAMASSTAT